VKFITDNTLMIKVYDSSKREIVQIEESQYNPAIHSHRLTRLPLDIVVAKVEVKEVQKGRPKFIK